MRSFALFAIILISIAWSMSAAWADSACASLDIHVKSDAVSGNQNCKDGQTGGGDNGTALTESIEIKGSGSYLYVSHLAAGVRTYLNQRNFEALVQDGTNFDRVENFTVHPSINKFSVRKFTGFMESDNRSYPCFALARYSGHVFSGYRHLVAGFYCEFIGEEVADTRVDEVMASIVTDF
ncbi:MAG: hypothetical protein ACREEE_17335 [Dongiaceae bacterium]